MARRPEPEVVIGEPFIRSLLREQAPHLADLALSLASRGWDNTNYRLGDDLLVRLPHRAVAAELIEHEQRWLPELAPRLDLAIPAPVVEGQPAGDYRWPWSIVPWNPGTEAAGAALVDPRSTATTLGRFYQQLHVAAPADAPSNPYRGVPLGSRRQSFEANAAALAAELAHPLRAIFEQACALEPSDDPVWLHGDLHLRNLVVHEGQLTAVIDWGDVCTGDRSTDLAGAFMLVPDHVDVVQSHAGASDIDWQRARGWAANFTAVYLAHSDDDPVMRSIGTDLFAVLTAV